MGTDVLNGVIIAVDVKYSNHDVVNVDDMRLAGPEVLYAGDINPI